MKRISFFLALAALVLMAAPTFGQDIYIDNLIGGFGTDSLNVNVDATWYLGANNQTGSKRNFSNGFQVFSPDGAQWATTEFDTIVEDLSVPLSAANFSFGSVINTFSIDGAGADTGGFFAQGLTSNTLVPAGFNDQFGRVTAVGLRQQDDGLTLCLDTLWFFPPGGTWAWVLEADTYRPTSFADAGPVCYTLYNVPDLSPVTTPDNANVSTSHCDPIDIGFSTVDGDPDPGDRTPIIEWDAQINNAAFGTVGFASSGTGSPAEAAVLTYTPTPAAVGASVTVSVAAKDQGSGQFGNYAQVNVTVTNDAPTITNCPTVPLQPPVGNDFFVDLNANDNDGCETLVWSIVSEDMDGAVSVDPNTGVVTVNPDPSDAGMTRTVCVHVYDGLEYSQDCCIEFEPFEGGKVVVRIEKLEDIDGADTSGVAQGQYHEVGVFLDKVGSDGIGGFDLLIGYDASVLLFQKAIEGDIYSTCDWEYFQYRFGPNGNCTNACPTGLLRITGIAETNNGPVHPVAGCPSTFPISLAKLRFFLTSDRTIQCTFIPIRFFWMDCGDNSISNEDGDTLYVSRQVYDFYGYGSSADPGFTAYMGIIYKDLVPDHNLPTWGGVTEQTNCMFGTAKGAPIFSLDLYNGGIDVLCGPDIDDPGDINLNGLAYEIADAVMFTNYFVDGLLAFDSDPLSEKTQASVQASDVNLDGLVLTVADLVYLIRVVVGDAQPFGAFPAKVVPTQARVSTDNGVVSVEGDMGAAYLLVKGKVTPSLTAAGMDMKYGYDGENTKVLVYSLEHNSFTGEFLNAGGEVLDIELATIAGDPVADVIVPRDYALNQNYPNPFNPTSTISFALPTAGHVSLVVYNITGQKVADFSGEYEAGVNEVVFDADGLGSGVYFYKMQAGNFEATKKMVLLK